MNGTNSTVDYLHSSAFYIGMILLLCVWIIVGMIGNAGVIVYDCDVLRTEIQDLTTQC